jgi:cytoskeletal protein RodZ
MATALRRDPIVQLGEFLRAARERAGLTLQQVASTTKIPQRHLDAIEHGDISVVPKGPYRRGEVRAFAEAVGLDQKVALARLEEALPEAPQEMPAAIPVEAVEVQRSWGAVLVLLVAVISLITLVLWNRDATSIVSVPPTQTPAPAAALQAPAPPPTDASTQAPDTSRPVALPATTADSPAAAAVTPVLVITSDPAGARVVVDGIWRGTTPATIELLALGEHGVRLVRDGYVSEERTVSLTSKRPAATMHVELRPNQ